MSRQARLEIRELVRMATVGGRECLTIVRVGVEDGQLHGVPGRGDTGFACLSLFRVSPRLAAASG